MTRFTTAALLLTSMFCALPAAHAAEPDCEAAFMAADRNKDGLLTESESKSSFDAYRAANRIAKDGTISHEAYLTDCRSGLFTTNTAANQPQAGAPFEGSNSFTEGQAMQRMTEHGLSDVTGLAKDDKGIWRASAKNNGASVKAALDYKGNVVFSK